MWKAVWEPMAVTEVLPKPSEVGASAPRLLRRPCCCSRGLFCGVLLLWWCLITKGLYIKYVSSTIELSFFPSQNGFWTKYCIFYSSPFLIATSQRFVTDSLWVLDSPCDHFSQGCPLVVSPFTTSFTGSKCPYNCARAFCGTKDVPLSSISVASWF